VLAGSVPAGDLLLDDERAERKLGERTQVIPIIDELAWLLFPSPLGEGQGQRKAKLSAKKVFD
jgi:hypothetical protein